MAGEPFYCREMGQTFREIIQFGFLWKWISVKLVKVIYGQGLFQLELKELKVNTMGFSELLENLDIVIFFSSGTLMNFTHASNCELYK